jgi:hypothetical protein
MNPVLEDDVFKVGAPKMFRYSQPQVVIFGGRERVPISTGTDEGLFSQKNRWLPKGRIRNEASVFLHC